MGVGNINAAPNQNPGAAAPALPTITFELDRDEDLEGQCGNFQRVWSIYVRDAVPGIIVQKITKTFQVQQVLSTGGRTTLGHNMSAREALVYAGSSTNEMNLTPAEYWEVFNVRPQPPANPTEADHRDRFSSGAFTPHGRSDAKETTVGWINMAASAQFYELPNAALTPTNLPKRTFLRDAGLEKDVKPANGLYAATSDPDHALVGGGAVRRGLPSVHSVRVSWDSRDEDRDHTGSYWGLSQVTLIT
jgi:hypothetical protein